MGLRPGLSSSRPTAGEPHPEPASLVICENHAAETRAATSSSVFCSHLQPTQARESHRHDDQWPTPGSPPAPVAGKHARILDRASQPDNWRSATPNEETLAAAPPNAAGLVRRRRSSSCRVLSIGMHIRSDAGLPAAIVSFSRLRRRHVTHAPRAFTACHNLTGPRVRARRSRSTLADPDGKPLGSSDELLLLRRCSSGGD